MDSVLRPRDIQARIRAGESPESVAAAAGGSVERVMVFATPVLAERAHFAELARKASVRRRAATGAIGVLGEAVAEQLAALGVDAGDVEWDSWRRDDGRWTVVADFGVGGDARRARFVFDPGGRYVVADDDEARSLVGERASAAEPADLPDGGPHSGRARRERLAVVDEQTKLGDDAIEMVTGRPRSPQRSPEDLEEPTVELSDTARAARTPVPVPEDWIATQASERPAAPAIPSSPPEALFDAAQITSSDPAEGEAEEPGTQHNEPDPEAAGEDRAAQTTPRKGKKQRSKGRASVPTWDEIMFGSHRGE